MDEITYRYCYICIIDVRVNMNLFDEGDYIYHCFLIHT